jgi:hypothetical protein
MTALLARRQRMMAGTREVAAAGARLLAPARGWCDAHLRFLAAVAVLSLLAGLPLFQFKEMTGHDSTAYLPRFVEFYEGLKGGAIVPRWAPDLGAGYGEPTFNFNPPLLYYLGSLFHALGFTFIASENLAIFALLLTAGAGMYLFASSIWGRHGGLVAAAAYVFAPHMLVRLYVSHALADFAAFAFIPFAFWGIYGAVVSKSAPHRIVGVLAVAALMLSSISVAVIVVPALALPLVWLAWRSRSPGGLAAGVWCIAMGIALTAFFWLPALRETAFVHISRREDRVDFHDHFLYIQQLFYSPWGYGLSVRGTGDGLSFAVGAVQLVMLGAAAVLLRPIWRVSAAAGAMLAALLALTLVAVFFTTPASLFVWERVGALHPLQFPWRFLALVMLASSFACGAPFLLLREGEGRQRAANWLMVALVAAIFLLNFRHADPQRFLKLTDADYSPVNIATKGLAATAREFEPTDVRQFPSSPAAEPMTVLSGRAAVAVVARTPTERTFTVGVEQAAELRMNTFYFPGWTLYVDGARQPTSHGNQNGLMDFPLAPGAHAVRFVFLDTPLRAWSRRLSLAALAIFLLAPAAEYAWRRRRSRTRAAR